MNYDFESIKLKPPKLEAENRNNPKHLSMFLSWTVKLKSYLRAMGLLGIITGEVTLPEEPYDTRPSRDEFRSAKSRAFAEGATSEDKQTYIDTKASLKDWITYDEDLKKYNKMKVSAMAVLIDSLNHQLTSRFLNNNRELQEDPAALWNKLRAHFVLNTASAMSKPSTTTSP